VLLEDVQNEMDICSMPFTMLLFHFSRSASGVDGDVVHIHRKPSLGDLFPEDGVHHHLERCRGIGEAKEHYRGFKESLWGEKGSLPFIPWFDPNIIVPPVDIKLCEEGATAEAVDGLWD
jgi:hypothetical protein